ncbi:MAG: hypothetical protein ACM3UZ_10740 [Acidobacteriota bacterium]
MIQAELQNLYGFEDKIEHTSQITIISQRQHRTASKKSKLIAKLAIFGFAFAVIAVFLYVQGALMGYKTVELKDDISKLDTKNKFMEYQIAQLSSLGRVQQVAETKLGMCKPETSNMVAMLGEPKPIPVIRTTGSSEEKSASALKKAYHKLIGVLSDNRVVGMKN